MPYDNYRRALTACCVIALAAGCSSAQLRRDTVSQMETVHELQQQQVLDNLAMFVHNRNSMPYFSVVSQGTCTLADTGSLAVTNSWQRAASGLFLYSALGVNPSVSRAHTGSWMVNPINDSVKLAVMRCVYRKAIEGCCGPSPDDCMNCDNLFYAYFNIVPPQPSNTIPYPGGPSNNPFDPSNSPVGSIKSTVGSVSADLSSIMTTLQNPPTNTLKGWFVTVDLANNSKEQRLVSDSKLTPTSITSTVYSEPDLSTITTTWQSPDGTSQNPPKDGSLKDWSITVSEPSNATENRLVWDNETTIDPSTGTKVTTITVKPAFNHAASPFGKFTVVGPPTLPNLTITVSPPFQIAPSPGDHFTLSAPPTLRPPISGIVTSDCLAFRPCWFCWGPKSPRGVWGTKCCRVGCYCGTYVWVPEEGVDELTKVVMMIDQIAYYEPPRVATSLVTVTGAAKSGGSASGGGVGGAGGQAQGTQQYYIQTGTSGVPTAFPYGVLGLQQTLQLAPQNVAPLIPQ